MKRRIRLKQITKLITFMAERQQIYLHRAAGRPKPWTRDPILQQYRFCNVYREQDAVTKWIAECWRLPNRGDRELWFAMTVARLLNLPESLIQVGYPVPWFPKTFTATLHRRQKEGLKVFNAAYIVSTNGFAMDKVEYLAKKVLTPMWKERNNITAVINNESLGTIPVTTLAQAHKVLTQTNGIGSFLGAQIIADLKYVQLRDASDWLLWASSGPGSRRGLNRICGSDPKERWREAEWLHTLQGLQKEINTIAPQHDLAPLHAQDLQNCLCEFDKYERVRLGQGRPKQCYPGGA